MTATTGILPCRQGDEGDNPLAALAREGARRLLAEAPAAEANPFVAAFARARLGDGRRRVVRHGAGPERTIQTGVGPVPARRSKVRDRCAGEVVGAGGARGAFGWAIPPRWAPRTKSLDALLPGLSSTSRAVSLPRSTPIRGPRSSATVTRSSCLPRNPLAPWDRGARGRPAGWPGHGPSVDGGPGRLPPGSSGPEHRHPSWTAGRPRSAPPTMRLSPSPRGLVGRETVAVVDGKPQRVMLAIRLRRVIEARPDEAARAADHHGLLASQRMARVPQRPQAYGAFIRRGGTRGTRLMHRGFQQSRPDASKRHRATPRPLRGGTSRRGGWRRWPGSRGTAGAIDAGPPRRRAPG